MSRSNASDSRKVVLITGCSSGGLGAALAIDLHKTKQYRVFATARNTTKLTETRSHGIEDLKLDVLSPSSISSCIQQLSEVTNGRLDMLINNAGAGYNMPVVDIDLTKSKEVFDLNVFSLITVTRACLPLLLKSSEAAKVVNNISIGAYLAMPCQATYHASKAAANSMTECMRLELSPFNIQVIALMTGSVKSNMFNNMKVNHSDDQLPTDSIYRIVPGGLKMMTQPEKMMTSESDVDAEVWAGQVVSDLGRKKVPNQIWRGGHASLARVACHFPTGLFDGQVKAQSKWDEVEKAVESRSEKERAL